MGLFDRFKRNSPVHSAADLPEIVVLGAFRRPRRAYPDDLTSVQSANDLPMRLTVGTLRDDDFVRNEDGWTASYRGRHPETKVELRLEHAQSGARVSLSEQWEGLAGPMSFAGSATWPALWQQHSMGAIPGEWESRLKQRVEQRFVSWYLPAAEQDTHMLSRPDGHLRTIVVPVGFRDLQRAAAIVPRLEGARDVDAPGSGYLALSQCYVHYRDELFPASQISDRALEAYVADRLGMLSVAPARPQVGQDGTRVRTVDRVQYLLAVTTFFGSLEAVLEHLAEAGLVGRMEQSADVTAGERMAVILPPMREYGGARFKDPTGEARRNYEYSRFVNMEAYMKTMQAAATQSMPPAVDTEQLRRAQAIGEALLARR